MNYLYHLKILFLPSIVWFVGQAVFAQSSALNNIVAKLQNPNGVTMQFSEVDFSQFNQQVANGKGKIYFQNGLVRFDYDPPDQQIIVVGKEKIWLYDNVLNNVTIAKLSQVEGLDSLIFFRQSTNLTKLYKVVAHAKWAILTQVKGQRILVLQNLKPYAIVNQIEVGYDEKTFELKRIAVIGSEENVRTLGVFQLFGQQTFKSRTIQLCAPCKCGNY